jgi:hypothetical protein
MESSSPQISEPLLLVALYGCMLYKIGMLSEAFFGPENLDEIKARRNLKEERKLFRLRQGSAGYLSLLQIHIKRD